MLSTAKFFPMKLVRFLTISYVCCCLISCQKEVNFSSLNEEAIQTTDTSLATNLACNWLPLTESWEKSSSLSNWYTQDCASYSLQLSDNHSRRGTFSLRSEIYYSDPIVNGGHRAEILRRPETSEERWYGFSIYPPSNYAPDPNREIVAQWHAMPDDGETNGPCVALKTDDGQWLVTLAWDRNKISTNTSVRTKVFKISSVKRNAWTDWVFHIKFSYTSDGFVQVWKNGKRIVNYQGPCAFNDDILPYQKLGVYKGSWKKGVKPAITHRVLYYDAISVADENGSYSDVAP